MKFSYAAPLSVFGVSILGAWAMAGGIPAFMGLSMLNLSVLKFVQLEGFVKSFRVYSLLAKRAKAYAVLYPFAELVLGIFLLAQVKVAWAAAISLLMGLEGVVSIVNTSFLKKEKVACACTGSVDEPPPLGLLSLAEQFMLIWMVAHLLPV